MNNWKPKVPWFTENFEDHRRFNPRATLKYDLMQIKPNYDPKMDGLFNLNERDTFHEMRANEIVKVLRLVLRSPIGPESGSDLRIRIKKRYSG